MSKRPASTVADLPSSPTSLIHETDRCVKCGLCLPHCPTYQIFGNESDSPRGRIALIEALATGALQPDATIDVHLDRCLLCRRCERVCPSGVNYGRMMDQARQLTRHHRPWWLRQLVNLTSRPRLFGPLLKLGRVLRLGGTHRLSRMTAIAQVSDRRSPPAPGVYPPLQPHRGRIGLFLGCASRHLQADALHDSLRLLRLLGFEVTIPPKQACCGALHAHLGDTTRAEALIQRNRAAFASDLDMVVSIATGCGAQLTEYPPDKRLLVPHRDINEFLADQPLDQMRWASLAKKVVIHTPCSQLNVLRSERKVRMILSVIPRIELFELTGNEQCCGAAGSYLFSHPETADRLKGLKIAALNRTDIAIAVTSNPGCALQLRTGLAQAGTGLAVLHPVQLLMRQYVD